MFVRTCPKCGKDTSASALKCEHCKSSLRPLRLVNTMELKVLLPSSDKESKTSFSLLHIVLTCLIFLVAVGAAVAWFMTR